MKGSTKEKSNRTLKNEYSTAQCLQLIHSACIVYVNICQKGRSWDFPGGAVVKNPPANAGDTGSSPGPGRSHMPGSN